MGVENSQKKLLVPYITAKFPGFRRENIIFVLDPACFQRSQVDEKTIAQAVMNLGFKVTKAPTNDPERRIQAVEGLLTQQIDGGPAFLIDAECSHIIDTLEWGHRYKKTAGGVSTTTIEKNHHSHTGDSVQYLALHYNAVGQGEMYRRSQAVRQVVAAKYRYC